MVEEAFHLDEGVDDREVGIGSVAVLLGRFTRDERSGHVFYV